MTLYFPVFGSISFSLCLFNRLMRSSFSSTRFLSLSTNSFACVSVLGSIFGSKVSISVMRFSVSDLIFSSSLARLPINEFVFSAIASSLGSNRLSISNSSDVADASPSAMICSSNSLIRSFVYLMASSSSFSSFTISLIISFSSFTFSFSTNSSNSASKKSRPSSSSTPSVCFSMVVSVSDDFSSFSFCCNVLVMDAEFSSSLTLAEGVGGESVNDFPTSSVLSLRKSFIHPISASSSIPLSSSISAFAEAVNNICDKNVDATTFEV
mmetsp:Transcript_29957/g.61154  ORF Transcript_29957/g.61154 Transcript_29957/m.61154 type:complete len:267 (+) Transcript_29957:101-901(+)